MKLFFSYLKSKRITIIAFFVAAAIYFVSFALYGFPIKAVVYPTVLCFAASVVFFTVGFIQTKKKHKTLERLKTFDSETISGLPKQTHIEEKDYAELITLLQKEVAKVKAEDFAKYRDMTDYYTAWVHQIKTPISSMKLTLDNEDGETARKISGDLFKIQQYVEMVLTYLRLSSNSTDYVFKEHRLDDIIRPCIKKFAHEFIGRRLSLIYEPIDVFAVTDDKWLSFVIEQLISNSLKYTNAGSISIYMKDSDTLCITDTGIGISEADIPRLFEKGFTGMNGRADKSASGLGLYLAKRVCDNLGTEISVDSEVGKGTTVSLKIGKKRTIFQ